MCVYITYKTSENVELKISSSKNFKKENKTQNPNPARIK